MNKLVGIAYAMGGGASGGAQGGMGSIVLLLALFGIFYFLLIRPQQKRQKEHRTMIENLRKGDTVLTAGGLYGKITGIKDQVVTLEIAEKIRVKVNKNQIAGVVREDVIKQ